MNRRSDHSLVLRGGRIIDPFNARDEVGDLVIDDGIFADQPAPNANVIDATGLLVSPGLTDIHVHLREPGQTHKETIDSGTAAAAAGGFTFVACMPNTNPPLDTPDAIRAVIDKARLAGHCAVGPVAAITRGREGRELTDFRALAQAGAVAFSDDGTGVEHDDLMRLAFERASALNVLLIQHCEYKRISAGGVMHLGDVSRRLGFPGLDPRSEEAMIERDIDLARQTGGRYHVAHISTARSVALVRRAKAEGLRVTAEVCPHHLLLTDEACAEADPNTKMHPPLRPQADVDACRQGLLDGAVDCIATDHAPHTAEEKAAGFPAAAPGIVGLETALGLTFRAMIEGGLVDWPGLIRWFTVGPAHVLGTRHNGVTAGSAADLTLIDPDLEWTVNPVEFASKGRNTPFSGWKLRGRALGTIRGTTLLSLENKLLQARIQAADKPCA